MKFTRRKFIQSSALAAFTAAVGQAAAGRDRGLFAGGPDPLGYLKKEHFDSLTGGSFRIRNDEGRTASVRLRETSDLKIDINEKRGYAGDSYRLGFDAPRKAGLTQGTYHFDHENLGRFSLFLVPVGGSEIHYEAIINRVC